MSLIKAICDAKTLKEHLIAADEIRQAKGLPHIEWGHIGRYFKAVARDNAARTMKNTNEDYESRSKHEQKDHIFELQYFAVALLYTMGQLAAKVDEDNMMIFWPAIDHITFAAEIANFAENLEYMTLEDHKFKSGFFRAGSSPKDPNDPIYELQKALLKTYLQNHAQSFSQRTLQHIAEIANDHTDPHRIFKLALMENILLTPWCTGEWDQFFGRAKKSPFSVNLTLDHYVPNAWVDDNMFFRAGRLNGKKDPED